MKLAIAKRRLSSLYFVILALSALFLQPACADSVLVTGSIANREGVALPGCTVFVISGDYRTPPSITDASGKFVIELPIKRDSPSYFLEIYWGQDLMYRKPLFRQPFNGPLWGTQDGVLKLSPFTITL